MTKPTTTSWPPLDQAEAKAESCQITSIPVERHLLYWTQYTRSLDYGDGLSKRPFFIDYFITVLESTAHEPETETNKNNIRERR
jgi:hypothetical protein